MAINENGVVDEDEDGSSDESEVSDGDAEIDPTGEEVDNHKNTAHGSDNSNEPEAPSQLRNKFRQSTTLTTHSRRPLLPM